MRAWANSSDGPDGLAELRAQLAEAGPTIGAGLALGVFAVMVIAGQPCTTLTGSTRSSLKARAIARAFAPVTTTRRIGGRPAGYGRRARIETLRSRAPTNSAGGRTGGR